MNTSVEKILHEVKKVIAGKDDVLEKIMMTVLSRGHVLLDDVPGTGKTTTALAFSRALGLQYGRIQFTPDVLPSDIVGFSMYHKESGSFVYQPGAVMTNLLLADEINRAIPRTQSALLEAMEERQVTIDGESFPLPRPFLVMATQNPVESESTFRLPAAQMDRFLIRLSLGYPSAGEELRMLGLLGDAIPFDTVSPVTDAGQIACLQREAASVHVTEAVGRYIVDLTAATRTHPLLQMGASPRASRALYRASKVWAAMSGRNFVTPDDVQQLVRPVLEHRLMLSGEARFSGRTAAEALDGVLASIEPPPGREELFGGR